jgi:hypothetical protein
MIFDARGKKNPEPLEEIREYVTRNCHSPIDFTILVDSSECAKLATTFSKMSKCQTETVKKDGHYEIRIKGDSCACS